MPFSSSCDQMQQTSDSHMYIYLLSGTLFCHASTSYGLSWDRRLLYCGDLDAMQWDSVSNSSDGHVSVPCPPCASTLLHNPQLQNSSNVRRPIRAVHGLRDSLTASKLASVLLYMALIASLIVGGSCNPTFDNRHVMKVPGEECGCMD